MASISLKELSVLISTIELKITNNSNIETDVINKLRNIVQSSREDSGEVIVLRNVMKLVVRVYSTVKDMTREQHGRLSLLFGDCIECLYDIIKRNEKGYADLRHDAIDAILVIYKKNNLTQNALFKSLSNTIMNIVNYPNIKLDVKKDFIKALNFILENTERKLRYKLRNDLKLERLSKVLYTCGDYDLQVNILETLFRYTGADDRKYFAKKWLPNNMGLISTFLNITDFEPDCRLFLNDFNCNLQNERLVYSIPCLKAFIGNHEIKKPMDPEYKEFWVDFNLGSRSVTIVCSQESLCCKSALTNEIVPGMWESISIESHTVNKVTLKKKSFSTDSQEPGYWKIQISFFQPCCMVFSSYSCNFEGNSIFITFENSLIDIIHMALQKLFPNNYYYELNEVKRPVLKKCRKSSVTFNISDTDSTSILESTDTCSKKFPVTNKNSSKMDQEMYIPQPRKDMVPNDLQIKRSNLNPVVILKELPTSASKSKTPVKLFRPLDIVISPSPKKSMLKIFEKKPATNQTEEGMMNIVQENLSEDHPQRPEWLKNNILTAKLSGLPAVNKTADGHSSSVKPNPPETEEHICVNEENLSESNSIKDNKLVNTNSNLEVSKKKHPKKSEVTKKKVTCKVETSLQSNSSKQEFHGRVLRSHVKAQNLILKNNSQGNEKVIPSETHYSTKNPLQKEINVNIKNVDEVKEASHHKKSYHCNDDTFPVKNDKNTRNTGAFNVQHSPNHISHMSLPTNLNLSDTDSDIGWLKTRDKKMNKKTVPKRKVQSLGDLHVKLLLNKECAIAKEDLKKKDSILKEKMENLKTNKNILGKNITLRLSNKKKLLNLNDQALLAPLTNEKDSMENNNEIVHDQSIPVIRTTDLETGKTSLSNVSLFSETGSEPSWIKNTNLKPTNEKITENENQIQKCRIDVQKTDFGKAMPQKKIYTCSKNKVKPAKRSFDNEAADNEEEIGEPRSTKKIRSEKTRKKSGRELEYSRINEKELSKEKNERNKTLTPTISVQNSCNETETEMKVQKYIINKKQVKCNQSSVIHNSLPITSKDGDVRDSPKTNKNLIPVENNYGDVLSFSSSKSNLSPSESQKMKDAVNKPMENLSMGRQSQKRKRSDAGKIISHMSKKIKECTLQNEQFSSPPSNSNKFKGLNRSSLVDIICANLDSNLSETNNFSSKSDNDETSEEDSNIIPSSFPENKSNNVLDESDHDFCSKNKSSALEIPRKLEELEKKDKIMSAKKASIKKIVSDSNKLPKEVFCFEKDKKIVSNNNIDGQEASESEYSHPKCTVSSSSKRKDNNDVCQINSPGKKNSSESSIDSLLTNKPVKETQFVQEYLSEISNRIFNLQSLKRKPSPNLHNCTADEIELESMIKDMSLTLASKQNCLKRKGIPHASNFYETKSQNNIAKKSNETPFTEKNKSIESAKLRSTNITLPTLNINTNDPHISQKNIRTQSKIIKGISLGNRHLDYDKRNFIQSQISSLKDYVEAHLHEKNKNWHKLGNFIFKFTEEASKYLADEKSKIWYDSLKKHICKIRKEIDNYEEKINDLDIIKARLDKSYKYITNTFYIKSEGDMDIKESCTKIEKVTKEMMTADECHPLEKFKAIVLPKITLLHKKYLQDEKKKEIRKIMEHISSLLH